MNKIFRVIWNHATQSWVAVSELTKAKGKTKSRSEKKISIFAVSLITAGATVIGGSALAAIVVGDGTNHAGSGTQATGSSAIAIGWGAKAGTNTSCSTVSRQAIAIGNEANASGEMSVAISSSAKATGDNSIAIGNRSNATTNRGIAIGDGATVVAGDEPGATGGIAIGGGSLAQGQGSLAIGLGNKAYGWRHINGGRDSTIAIGEGNTANLSSVAVGRHNNALGDVSFVLGVNSTTTTTAGQSVAIGTSSKVSGGNSFGFGSWTRVESDQALAIGSFSGVWGETNHSIAHESNATNRNNSYRSTAVGGVSARILNSYQASVFGSNTCATTSNRSVALGSYARIFESKRASALGSNVTVNFSANATALGTHSSILSSENASLLGANAIVNHSVNSTALGSSSNITNAAESTAVGRSTLISDATNGTVIGTRSKITAGDKGIAVGVDNTIRASNAGAMGANNTLNAEATNSYAIGNNINLTTSNSVVLGHNAAGNLSATTETSTTLNGVTYGGFKGAPSGKGSYVSVGSSDSDSRQIKYVAAGNISENSTDAINGSQLYAVLDKGAWKLGNSTFEKVDDVKFGDQVNFINGTATTAVVTTNGTVSNVTYNVNVDNSTIKVVDGKLVANTGNIETGNSKVLGNGTAAPNTATKTTYTDANGQEVERRDDGKYYYPNTNLVVPSGVTTQTIVGDENKVATVGDIVNTINRVYHTVNTSTHDKQVVSNANATGVQVKAGDTVQFIAGKNLEINQDGYNITYGLSENITVNNVTANNLSVGPVNITNKGIDAGNKPITNVSNGTNATDAVNVSQLNASKSSVVAGSNVNVSASSDANGTVYTVNAYNTTASSVNADYVTVASEFNGTTNTTNYAIDLSAKAKNVIDNAITNVTNTTTANITNNNGNISVDVNTGKVTAENGKAVSNTTNGPIATVEDVANTINNVGWRIGNNTGAMVNLVKAGNQVNFVNGSATIANVSAVNGTVTNVSYDVNVDNNTITVVDGKLVANTSNIVNQLTGNSTVTDGRANATVNNVDNSNKVATVGDIVNTINNVSWGVTSGNVSGTNGEFSITDKANATVKAGDTVTYNAGQNIKIEQNGKTFNISTTNNVTFNHVNTTTLTVGNASDPSNSTNITSGPDGLNVNGDKITGIANGTISNNSKDAINGSQLYNLGDSITNIFGGNTTFNTTTGQVEGFERTLNTTGLAKDENYVAPTSPANNITEAFEQLNNYVNAGWKVGGADGQTVERISPDEQVNFVNSDTITSTVVVNDKGGANISFNVNSTAIAKAATGTVSANTTTGKAESNNYNGSRPLATVTDVENTVNNVYHTVNATNSDIQVVATNGTTQIKAGDTLNFEAGKNLVVNQTGKNIAFGLAENISVNNINATGSITVGNTTINNGSVTNLVNNLNATNSIATNSNGKNASSADAPSIVNGTNAATVNDVLNTGWNLQENGKAKDFVAAYDTVNFVNGTGTTVTVTTTNGSTSVIKVDVVADGNTIKVQPNGNLTANTTNIVVNNGTASVDPNGHGSNLVNATTIVNTVNNVSWNVNAMASGTGKVINLDKDGQPTTTQEATPVKAGNTVNVNAGNNIEITRQGANITVATSMNPTFNTVQVGGNASGPIIRSDEKGNLVIGRPDVANNTLVPTQIKNVAPGTDPTDAVNVSQLKGSITNINNHINKVNKEARGGIAGSNAAASLPQVYLPGKSMMAASAGTFKGENAFAVGYSRASDNGKLILKLQGNANSQGDVGAGVGVGYQW